ncbi:hypothetical protein V8E36_006614 [Tilletia maclaganii]
MDDYLKCLTEPQRHAVTRPSDESLQILAGPGSGKTRVLTSRAAWMVKEGHVQPDRLVLVNFTDKAANEMVERLKVILGPASTSQLIIGTFHAICCRYLRRYGQKIGLSNSFTIADVDTVKKILKSLIQSETHAISAMGGEATMKPDAVLSEISKAKSKNISASDYRQSITPKCSPFRKQIAHLYELYEEALQKITALDFDDLLLYGVRLMKNHPEAVKDVQHVLVDELQDIDTTQFQLMELLAQHCRAVTTVGDPDQSIYGWRSAEVANFEKMVNNFKGTQRVCLEENFRSTGNIVDAALKVVQQDSTRVQKQLYTSHASGPAITVKQCRANDAEAAFIVSEIKRVIAHSGNMLTYDDFVVLLRYDALSRVLEAELQKENVAYRLMGGVKFFHRAEVKDLVAFLHLADNPDYEPTFDRIVHVPEWEIGDKGLVEIKAAATKAKLSPMALAIRLSGRGKTDQLAPELTGRLRTSLSGLGAVVAELQDMVKQGKKVSEMIEKLLELIHYDGHLAKQPDYDSRKENVKELINFAVGLEKQTDLADVALTNDKLPAALSSSKLKLPAALPSAASSSKLKLGSDDEDDVPITQLSEDVAAEFYRGSGKADASADTITSSRTSQKRKVATKYQDKAKGSSKGKGKGKGREDPIVLEDSSDRDYGAEEEEREGDEYGYDDFEEIEPPTSKRAKTEHTAATAAVQTSAGEVGPNENKGLLRVFLEAATMSTDMEVQEEGKAKPRVTLSTCHVAKGLEWPVVFIVGIEDGVIPMFHCKEPHDIAEERRLLYVAITRAKTMLYMSWVQRRQVKANFKDCQLSQFLTPVLTKSASGSAEGTSQADKAKQIKIAGTRPKIDQAERELWGKMLGRPVAARSTVKTSVAAFEASETGKKVLDGSIDSCHPVPRSSAPFNSSNSLQPSSRPVWRARPRLE